LFLVGNSETHSCETQGKNIFKNQPLIFREKGSGTRIVMEEYISKKKFTIHKKLELTTNEAVKQALMADLGISIVPLIGIRNEIMNHELNIIPMKGLPIKTTWHLIWLKEKKLSPIANAFLKFLGEEKENIVREKFEWCNEF
jgi:DNA-binding transcriptional LysR family regulator